MKKRKRRGKNGTLKPDEIAKLSKDVKSMTEQSSYYYNGNPIVYENIEELDENKPIVAELFCGLGGTSLGFEMAGFETVLGTDIHKPSIETFRKSHPEATCILGNIRKLLKLRRDNSQSILIKTIKNRLKERQLDVLLAGIPCQGFSITNRKRSEFDERNYIFYYFLEAVKCLKPKVIVLENVSGLKTLGNGKFANTIEYFLREAGYNTHHKILNASDYGVPQSRKRVVFLGSRNGKIPFPKPSVNQPLAVKDAIKDLPALKAGETKNEYLAKKKGISEYTKLMRGNCNKLHNHEAPRHPEKTVKRIKDTKPGQPIYNNFKQRIRLHWDKPSPTQVSGGIRPQFQFGHPSQSRGLSVRERARIQSIPDHIQIFGGLVQGRVQTGNAVPPLLAKQIALNMKVYL